MTVIQSDRSILDELKQAIDRRPGTRGDFARAVGIGQVYLSQILAGKRPISRLPMETGRKISEVSGIPLERLASEPAATPPLAPEQGGRE